MGRGGGASATVSLDCGVASLHLFKIGIGKLLLEERGKKRRRRAVGGSGQLFAKKMGYGRKENGLYASCQLLRARAPRSSRA